MTFSTLVTKIISILGGVVPILIGLAVVMFLWGIFKVYFLNQDDAGAREEGKNFILWGILAIFVMVSVWGLVAILKNTFFGI